MDFFENLPAEILQQILFKLGVKELIKFGATCKTHRSFVFQNPYLWSHHLSERWTKAFERVIKEEEYFSVYRQLFQSYQSLRKGHFQISFLQDVQQPVIPNRERENAIFSCFPVGSDHVIAGGSVPSIQVFDLNKRKVKFRLDAISGLCMGFDEDSGIICGGGNSGSLFIYKGFDPDMRKFLKNQSVRYLKQELVKRKRGWGDVLEKSEMIEAILSNNACPSISPMFQIDTVRDVTYVDCLVKGKDIYASGWDPTIHQYRLEKDGVVKVGTFVGHDMGCNAIRCKGTDEIMSAGSDGLVKVWDIESRQEKSSKRCSDQWIWCLESLDYDKIFTAGIDHHARLFDHRVGDTALWSFQHYAEVSGLSIQHDNQIFMTSCFDGAVRFFDLRNMEKPLFVKRLSSARLTRCHLREEFAVCGSFEGITYFLDFRPSEKVFSL